MSEIYLGIDIGSTTFKAVLLSAKSKVRHSLYMRTKPAEGRDDRVICGGRCHECGKCHLGALKKTIGDFLASAGIREGDVRGTVVTGSQIVEELHRFIKYDHYVSEISAHVAGTLQYYPDCKAILDVGGQDSKAILYNDGMKMWTSKMSGICAAGTGAFLDSVAAKLNIPVESMADKVNYDSDLEFSSVCAVLSATSINKFKNRFPLGDIIGGACRAQARTVMSGVGEIFLGYKGDILFQGGVAANRAVAYYLKEITGNNIIIPEFHRVMGALGAAVLAKQYCQIGKTLPKTKKTEIVYSEKLKAVSQRANLTRREFFSSGNKAPLVWRNLFFPSEILNAMGLRSLTLETYAALHARSQKKIRKALDNAACKGFSAETCSFLRVLQGIELPKPDFIVSTNQPCQQGERVFRDLAKSYGVNDKFYSLHTPVMEDNASVETIAEGLEEAVFRLEKATGITLDNARLAESCELSNEAREIAMKCNDLRLNSPPLVRGSDAVYFASMFSQLWGKREFVLLQKNFLEDLEKRVEKTSKTLKIEDSHRILWLHLPPFYNSKLLDFIEVDCLAPIIFEEVNFVGWEPLSAEDPYRSLAKKLLTVGFLDPHLRVSHVINTSIKGKLNGCILYNHMFGRCSMSDSCFIKDLREELARAKIPLLVLDGDCIDPTIDPCSTYTKVSSYIEALNEKKYGNIFGTAIQPNHNEENKQMIPFEMAKAL
jgi:activator of 2-hydroxyglutaryl-CoA dehydratase/benzoyl-CoA reductase/2-hydroxyglutaryl-CoA dehydratase subunit BcrC/BadD/HgdB